VRHFPSPLKKNEGFDDNLTQYINVGRIRARPANTSSLNARTPCQATLGPFRRVETVLELVKWSFTLPLAAILLSSPARRVANIFHSVFKTTVPEISAD
jgi:hypothetical protein